MRKKLVLGTTLAGLIAGGLVSSPASATAIYQLTTTNTSGVGSGPYAQVSVSLVNATTASIVVDRLNGYWFGDAGVNLNVNASNFQTSDVSAVSFIANPADSKTPSFSVQLNSGVVGNSLGNFTVVENDQPNGYSSSVSEISFTITDPSGTWSTATNVLALNTDNVYAGIHAFTPNGSTSFVSSAVNTPTCSGNDCTTVVNQQNTPEPASLAILGTGLIGVALFRLRRSR